MIIWANASEVNIAMVKEIHELYGGWAKKHLTNFKPWELSVILRQIQRHFGDRKDISILDFGAGINPFGAYLNHIGYSFVTCIDKERGWLRTKNMNTKEYNERYNAHVQYVKTDDISIYTGRHDVIFSASVLEHIEKKWQVETMCALAKSLLPGGLMIHVVDYYTPKKGRTPNIKKLIDNCGIPISYKPEEVPGCKGFKGPPDYTWWYENKISRIAFFNERE